MADPHKVTWEAAKRLYPDEWVAFVDYDEVDGFLSAGVVVAHHPDRKPFHAMVKTFLPQYHDMTLLYTGQRIKNPELPLLWQITGTISTND